MCVPLHVGMKRVSSLCPCTIRSPTSMFLCVKKQQDQTGAGSVGSLKLKLRSIFCAAG